MDHQRKDGSFGNAVHDTFAPLALLASGEAKYLPAVERNVKYQCGVTNAKNLSLINWSYMSAAILISPPSSGNFAWGEAELAAKRKQGEDIFIRDVRKDLSAPKLPFVIGVMGIDGIRGDRNAPMMQFRESQRKPSTLDEFEGNVIAVETAPFWNDDLEKLQERLESFWPTVDAKVEGEKKNNPSADSWENKMKFMAENCTPKEWKRLTGASNGRYHYLGAAKIMAPIGQAFAEALVEIEAVK